MSKIFIVLCVVLVASVAWAYDPEAEEQKKLELARDECNRSINKVFSEVAEKYEKTVKPLTDEDLRNKAFNFYNVAAEKLNNLRAQMKESKVFSMSFVLKTFGGNAITCSDDVSRSVYSAYYDAYDGLDNLA